MPGNDSVWEDTLGAIGSMFGISNAETTAPSTAPPSVETSGTVVLDDVDVTASVSNWSPEEMFSAMEVDMSIEDIAAKSSEFQELYQNRDNWDSFQEVYDAQTLEELEVATSDLETMQENGELLDGFDNETAMDGRKNSSIYFELNSSKLTPEGEAHLDDIAEEIERRGDLTQTVVITGLSDSSGAAGHNMKLSQDRAVAVSDGLEARGVKQDILVQAIGEQRSDSAVPPDSVPGHRDESERRVDIGLRPEPLSYFENILANSSDYLDKLEEEAGVDASQYLDNVSDLLTGAGIMKPEEPELPSDEISTPSFVPPPAP